MADTVVDNGAPAGPAAVIPASAVVTPASVPVAAPVVAEPAPVSLDVAPIVDIPADAPAVDIPAAEPAPVVEKTLAKTILAEAGNEPVPEPVAPTDEPAPIVDPPVASEPLTYEAFTLPEGVTLDQAELGKYTEVLGKHRLPQEAVQELVSLFVAQQQEAAQKQLSDNEAAWERIRGGWLDAFQGDPEIGGNRRDTTVKACGAVLERYGQQFGRDREAALRHDLEITGMGNHPELIRMMNWMSKFAAERTRPVAATVPKAPQVQSRGQRRYAGSLGNGAA